MTSSNKCLCCRVSNNIKTYWPIYIIVAVTLWLSFQFYQESSAENRQAYASLISGFVAILAAYIAFFGLKKQIQSEDKRFYDQIKIQQEQASLESMQKQYEVFLKFYQISSALSADISAILKLLENTPFSGQYSIDEIVAFTDEPDQAPLITIEEDFLSVFDALITQIVLEGKNLNHDVHYWYTRARGFVDQVKYNMNYLNKFDTSRKRDIIKEMLEDCEFFKTKGNEIISSLDILSARYFNACLKFDNHINRFIAKAVPEILLDELSPLTPATTTHP